MAEEKKGTKLGDFIREKYVLLQPTKENRMVSCLKCQMDFLSTERWEVNGRIILQKISNFGKTEFERASENSALYRMQKNTAFESKLSGIIDEFVGNTYFCRFTGAKFMFTIPDKIKYLIPFTANRYMAVSDTYIYVLLPYVRRRKSLIPGYPLTTTIFHDTRIAGFSIFFMESMDNKTDIEVRITEYD